MADEKKKHHVPGKTWFDQLCTMIFILLFVLAAIVSIIGWR